MPTGGWSVLLVSVNRAMCNLPVGKLRTRRLRQGWLVPQGVSSSERYTVGSVADFSHHSHTHHRVFNNLVDMLLYASSGLRAPRTNGAIQEETPQGYPIEIRVPFKQDR